MEKGFDDPFEANIVFLIEPKEFIKDIGLFGVENTFIIKKDGIQYIIGNKFNIIKV